MVKCDRCGFIFNGSEEGTNALFMDITNEYNEKFKVCRECYAYLELELKKRISEKFDKTFFNE